MRQLQLLIDRRNLKKSPKENMNAAEDFMEVVTVSHVIAAALKYFGMVEIHATPQGLDEVKRANSTNKQKLFLGIIQKMLTKQILLHDITSGPALESDDQVAMYARELLTLGLLLAEYGCC